MIMARQVCGGGSIGRAWKNGSAFFGIDALRSFAGRAGDGAAGADFARAGAAVGDARFAERTVDDGEVLRSVSGRSDRFAEASAKPAAGIGGGSGGVRRVCAGSANERGMRGVVCWRIRPGADYYVGEYSGGPEVHDASRLGAGDAELFFQPGSDDVGAPFGVVAAAVCVAWIARGFCRTVCAGWAWVDFADAAEPPGCRRF